METQQTQTQTLEAKAETSPPVVASEAETPATPDAAVAVEGVEVAVTDKTGGLELTPATGSVAVLVLGLLVVAVLKLRKK